LIYVNSVQTADIGDEAHRNTIRRRFGKLFRRLRTLGKVLVSPKSRVLDKNRPQYAPPSTQGDVRVGPLLIIPSLLREHNIDPSLVLGQVGLDVRIFEDPENRVSFDALGRLLETCVKVTGCPHFGLRIGQQFNIGSLGVLGQLMCNCPSVRDALRLAALHLELHDRGAVSVTLDLGSGKTALGYSLFERNTAAAAQILDGAIAMQYLLLRGLCGRAWKPLSIHLSHRRPTEVAPFKNFFRAPIEFDVPTSCILFESRWLDHPIDGADPAAFAAIKNAIESTQPQQVLPFIAQVRKALLAMMLTGSASAANLAQLFNMQERTLRRRLDEERATVRSLVSEVRRELAYRLLRDTNLSASEIAAALRYSDVSVFARAFRSWSDMNSREWRAKYTGVRSDSLPK
jgi:AraC-like DNA-binding protein